MRWSGSWSVILDHWDHSSSKDLINRCPIPLMHNDPSDLGSQILIQITFKWMYHKRRWRVRELMSQVSLISKVTRPQFISGSVAAPEIPGGSKTPERATRIYYLFTHSHSLTYVESPACSTNTVMIKFRSLLSISAPLRMRPYSIKILQRHQSRYQRRFIFVYLMPHWKKQRSSSEFLNYYVHLSA